VRIRYQDSDLAAFARESMKWGPNAVHAMIIHGPGRPGDWPEGSVEDLGVSQNLLTTVGRDLVFDATIRLGINNGANVATGASATSLTDTGEAWTTDLYKGWTVIAEETTNTPVYGNIGTNSGTVLTVDAWKNADDSAGTTPGSTCNYAIYPTFRPRYMGLTENAGAAAAGSTVLTGEITTGGCNRQVATPAHTAGTATGTLVKSYSVTGSFPAIHKIGLFTASNTTAAGVLCYEVVLNADANVINGDTLAVTWTLTVSG
jgi:hypothetical protein